MGVVYKAKDERLDRFVALKFLPPDLTRDPDAKLRFVQEAKAASALEHNNICTIYEIDETPDGQVFLALAYYDGETLRQRIERGPLPLEDALRIAIEIGRGLAAAHESAIVHRDVKPANVMITRRGEVKVVDFGLAKLVGQATLTRTGTTLGTVPYMSPEQAQGDQIDVRTDIWSLGVVLFEMLTGQLPFKGDDAFAVANGIVHHQPAPVTSLRSGLPLAIERIVTRALAKRADERYQTMADMIAELRHLRRASETGADSVLVSAGNTPRRPSLVRRWATPIVVIGLLAGALVYWSVVRESSDTATPRLSNAVQVTSAVGVEEFPTWSPEGDRLAYTAGTRIVDQDIWVTQVGGGAPVNRTADSPGPDLFPDWSPDGRQIAFLSVRESPGIYVMPAVAGGARLLKTGPEILPRSSSPRWSRDGTRVAYLVRAASAWAIEILSLKDGSSTRLPLPPRTFGNRYELTWSPDERFFAYVDSTDLLIADVTRIWIVRVADQQTFAATPGRTRDVSPSWSTDGRSLYFVSNRGGSMDLWQQSIADDGTLSGPAHAVTTGVGIRRAVFSRDGRRLAYSKGVRLANIWRVPIMADRPATWADAQQLTFDEAYIEHLDVSPDGKRLVVSSDRTGNPDLWLLPAEGGDLQPLAVDPAPDWYPRWSPDGTQIAFYAYRSGFRNIWVMPATGGAARQVTHTEATDWYSSWSPDGQRLAFQSNRGGDTQTWVVSAAGGEPRQLGALDGPGGVPEWRDDLRIVRTFRGELWTLPVAGGNPEPLPWGKGIPSQFVRLSPDRATLYHRMGEQYWAVRMTDGAARMVTNLVGRPGAPETAIATDGRYLYFGWGEDRGDLWVIDVDRDGR